MISARHQRREPVVLVLGAGLAGLACAHTLAEAGHSCNVLEAEDVAGGLARSESSEGFTFDRTGHWLHLREPGIRRLVEELLGDDLLVIERAAWIYTGGRFIPYPYQSNTWALPEDVRAECLIGMVRARLAAASRSEPHAPRHFGEFLVREFGEGLASHFLIPYNEKLWTVPLESLSVHGTNRFVPVPAWEAILRGGIAPPELPDGYNARFVYPRRGGIGILAERLALRLPRPVRLSTRVTRVDLARRVVSTATGETFAFEQLVSTLPLPSLIAMCVDVPASVRLAARGLRAVDVTYVNLGVRNVRHRTAEARHWVYFPDRDVPFYRAGIASDAVESLAPPGGRTYWVEFSHRGPAAAEQMIHAALKGLRACNLLHADEEIAVASARTIPGAYVLFDHEHAERRAVALTWLAERGVRSIGRYGEWDYGSMEDALRQGQATARSLLSGEPVS